MLHYSLMHGSNLPFAILLNKQIRRGTKEGTSENLNHALYLKQSSLCRRNIAETKELMCSGGSSLHTFPRHQPRYFSNASQELLAAGTSSQLSVQWKRGESKKKSGVALLIVRCVFLCSYPACRSKRINR